MTFSKAIDPNKLLTTKSKVYILKPEQIFIDKFLCIYTNSKDECLNAKKYFQSKFYRAGLASKMTSWILYRNWHSNIPQISFNQNVDIDFTKPIDSQLYKLFKLTNKQIETIEKYVK